MPPTFPSTAIEPEIAPHVTSSRAESSARRYFAIAIAICLLVYVFPFAALRSGWNPRWLLSYWGSVIDVTYQNQHQDADVVIFGDSTAATNFDPAQMTRDLNMKVIVLPNVSTSLPVTGYSPLEQYLQTNKKPRLIIFYLSGWDLDFMHNPFTHIVEEGEEMLLLHGSRADVLKYARSKPRQILMFPLHFYATSNRFGDLLYFRSHEVPEMNQGHIVLLSHPTPMKSDCEFTMAGSASNAAADASVREGVAEFTTPGTQTMVFVSPLPDCKRVDELRSVKHPGLAMPPVQVLPPERFRDDGWQAHMLSSAIAPSTAYLETSIREALHMDVTASQP